MAVVYANYRYGKRREETLPSLDEAVCRALYDVDANEAYPFSISKNGEVVYSRDQIYDVWLRGRLPRWFDPGGFRA